MARVRNNKVVKSSSGASHGPICRTRAKVREHCWDWSDIAPLSTDEMTVVLYGSPPIPGATATPA